MGGSCSSKNGVFAAIGLAVLLLLPGWAAAEERSTPDRIALSVQKLGEAVAAVEAYSCDVEQVFFREGQDDLHYRFRFHFKKGKGIRVDFSQPYAALTIFYGAAGGSATVVPFRSMPAIRLRLSPANSMLKTPAGQRIDQTDLGYFVRFVRENREKVPQEGGESSEDAETVTFGLRALDYLQARSVETYRITLSKTTWFPVRIDRYDVDGRPVERIHFLHVDLNPSLSDRFFSP
jgi:outer membrane lipoprotein-sorting protein